MRIIGAFWPRGFRIPALRLVAALAVGAVVSSCQETARIDPSAGGGGLAGNWAPDGGGYAASFDNGVFRTMATDTGNVISEGSYVALSASQVELRWQSRITSLPNTAQCVRPDPNQLNCTDQSGKAFTLRRVAS
jgi:hypothetical protein